MQRVRRTPAPARTRVRPSASTSTSRRARAGRGGVARRDRAAERVADQRGRRVARALDQLAEPVEHALGVELAVGADAPWPGRSGAITRCVAREAGDHPQPVRRVAAPGRAGARPAGRRRPRARRSGCPPSSSRRSVDGDAGEQPLAGVRRMLVVAMPRRYGTAATPRASPASTNFAAPPVVISDHAQTRWCANAKALAAVREETPSLAKMFCRWRATVCSLITSAAAIARLLSPPRPGAAPRARAPSGRGAGRRASATSASTAGGAAPSRANAVARRLELERGRCRRRPARGTRGRPARARARSRRAPRAAASPRHARRGAPSAAPRRLRPGPTAARACAAIAPSSRPQALGEPLELARRPARRSSVADGEQDLDARRQQAARAVGVSPSARRIAAAAAARRPAPGAAARARAGAPTRAGSRPGRPPRPREITAQPVQLAPPVVRPAGGARSPRCASRSRGAPRLGQRRRARRRAAA